MKHLRIIEDYIMISRMTVEVLSCPSCGAIISEDDKSVNIERTIVKNT